MSRLVLKYPEPVVTEESGHGALFDITPQSAPVIPSTLQTEWEQLQSALRTRLSVKSGVRLHKICGAMSIRVAGLSPSRMTIKQVQLLLSGLPILLPAVGKSMFTNPLSDIVPLATGHLIL